MTPRARTSGLATALAALLSLDASAALGQEVLVIGQRVGPLDSADVVASVDVLGGEEIQKLVSEVYATPKDIAAKAAAMLK